MISGLHNNTPTQALISQAHNTTPYSTKPMPAMHLRCFSGLSALVSTSATMSSVATYSQATTPV